MRCEDLPNAGSNRIIKKKKKKKELQKIASVEMTCPTKQGRKKKESMKSR
jgi:hypothetical protein